MAEGLFNYKFDDKNEEGSKRDMNYKSQKVHDVVENHDQGHFQIIRHKREERTKKDLN